jgi:hypothetical protein
LTAGPLEPCGHLTAKDFSKFHGLLLAAVATIFGQRAQFGMSDKNGGKAHQEGCGEQELIDRKCFVLDPTRQGGG